MSKPPTPQGISALNCEACWHLWSVHGPSGCHAKIYPSRSLTGERCPCGHVPGTEPPTAFPLSIVVFCDECGLEVEHDYLVHDLMTREQRLAVAREHVARNEGWSCTADGDYCPDHKPSTEADR